MKHLLKYNESWEPRWTFEKSYKHKKETFVEDVINTLTGIYGFTEKYNRKSLNRIIGNIFDQSMRAVHSRGIQIETNQLNAICRMMGVPKEYGDFREEDQDMIGGYIELEFNGE
jgi:hypothetical protein